MKTYTRSIQKAMVYLIIFLMLGITGILNIVSFTSGEVHEKCAEDDAPQVRGSVIRSTSIDGYIELWDVYSYTPHDGIFGDENDYYYKFHLGSKYSSFRLYLKNIDYIDMYLQNIVTYL